MAYKTNGEEMEDIFTNQTANGSHSHSWAGGQGTLFAAGVFDGAQVVVKASVYSRTIRLDRDLLIDSEHAVNFTVAECDLDIQIVNAGPNTDLSLGIGSF